MDSPVKNSASPYHEIVGSLMSNKHIPETYLLTGRLVNRGRFGHPYYIQYMLKSI